MKLRSIVIVVMMAISPIFAKEYVLETLDNGYSVFVVDDEIMSKREVFREIESLPSELKAKIDERLVIYDELYLDTKQLVRNITEDFAKNYPDAKKMTKEITSTISKRDTTLCLFVDKYEDYYFVMMVGYVGDDEWYMAVAETKER